MTVSEERVYHVHDLRSGGNGDLDVQKLQRYCADEIDHTPPLSIMHDIRELVFRAASAVRKLQSVFDSTYSNDCV